MVIKFSDKDGLIINFLHTNSVCSSKQIHDHFVNEMSYATIKRSLKDLVHHQLVSTIGKGKTTKYCISELYQLLRPLEVEKYFLEEIDERKIIPSYNFDLLQKTLKGISIFSSTEMEYLENLQLKFRKNIELLSTDEYKKELERLAIDLSWKSSQIEGNTYSLLETELLLKEKQTAAGKTKDEATMLLNHKEAIDFIIEHPKYIKPLSVSTIEDIHSILIKDLNINKNIRNSRVGISGTNYKPLDNQFQIKEALNHMCELVNASKNVFEKAFLTLMLISYIQPFSDGNKRTARIISNAILLKYLYCPISFRTVDAIEYKKAMLIFYEQNNISPFKRIFINQFEFAVNTYF